MTIDSVENKLQKIEYHMISNRK